MASEPEEYGRLMAHIGACSSCQGGGHYCPDGLKLHEGWQKAQKSQDPPVIYLGRQATVADYEVRTRGRRRYRGAGR